MQSILLLVKKMTKPTNSEFENDEKYFGQDSRNGRAVSHYSQCSFCLDRIQETAEQSVTTLNVVSIWTATLHALT